MTRSSTRTRSNRSNRCSRPTPSTARPAARRTAPCFKASSLTTAATVWGQASAVRTASDTGFTSAGRCADGSIRRAPSPGVRRRRSRLSSRPWFVIKLTVPQRRERRHSLASNVSWRPIAPFRIVLGSSAQSKDPIEIPWVRQTSDISLIHPTMSETKTDPKLLQAVVRAHVWLNDLHDGRHASIHDLAAASRLHPKVVRQGLRLAFRSPATTSTILDGQTPQIETNSEISATGLEQAKPTARLTRIVWPLISLV